MMPLAGGADIARLHTSPPNFAVEQTIGSRALVSAAHRGRSGARAPMLWLPVNRVGTLMMFARLVLGGILAAAPAWGQSLLPGHTALAEVPIERTGCAGRSAIGYVA
jgi:hypothetical protein